MIKCPRCNKEFNGFPALSKSDNKTPICPSCGTTESMWEFSLLLFGKNNNKPEKILNKLFLLDVLINNSNYITKKHFLKIKNQLMDVKY